MVRFDDPVARAVIGCAIQVHRHLGPGLMESVYQRCLCLELEKSSVPHIVNAPVPINYDGLELNCGYRLDLLVDSRLIIELKAVERVLPVHDAQVLTYLKLLKLKRALLINFNVPRLVDGLKAFVL